MAGHRAALIVVMLGLLGNLDMSWDIMIKVRAQGRFCRHFRLVNLGPSGLALLLNHQRIGSGMLLTALDII